MTLDNVIAPYDVTKFLSDYVGRQYLRIEGESGRFRHLLSWRDLNRSLACLRLGEGRVSLVRQGRSIPETSYIAQSRSGRSQYLIGPAVTRLVAAGATLVVNQVDELFPEIKQLAESCERVFHIYTTVNLYAGWRRDHGFDVHWDGHDTLILQVQGFKDWKVWAPSRLHPLDGEHKTPMPRPTLPPDWEGTLHEGDVLYMPRGWWHVASPRDDVSLHLTVGLKHPTGIDLLTWGVEHLRESVLARMDLPHWRDSEAKESWLVALRGELMSILSERPIERYFDEADSTAHTRPIVRLSEHLEKSSSVALSEDMQLRLTRGRRLALNIEGSTGVVSFTNQGTTWQCHASLIPALRLLNNVEPCTLADMRRAIDSSAIPFLYPFLLALIIGNVIWTEPGERSRV
jgi:ribosomal protein L16 Arg81 hydroxylase